jgi:hypothetical protein
VFLDAIGALFHGFAIALTPGNLLAVFLGAFIGTVIGVLPGLVLLYPLIRWAWRYATGRIAGGRYAAAEGNR